MAKAQTKKTKTTKTTKTQKTSAVRKGALAYLGLYGVAYERAVMRAEQVKGLYATKVKGSTDGLFTELVARGEKSKSWPWAQPRQHKSVLLRHLKQQQTKSKRLCQHLCHSVPMTASKNWKLKSLR